MTYTTGASPDNAAFLLFPLLPAELRLLVWRMALGAPACRTIPLVLTRYMEKANHHCDIQRNGFCGSQSSCEGPGSPQPVYTMIGGYFRFPGRETEVMRAKYEYPIQQLNLACHESRQQVLECYPDMMKVFSSRYRFQPPYRLIRYNAATDIFIITAIMGLVALRPVGQSTTSLDNHRDLPQDPAILEEFAATLSSFQAVVMSPLMHPTDLIEDREDTMSIIDGELNVPGLIVFMPSLRNLYLCAAGQVWYGEARHNLWLENIDDLQNETIQELVGREPELALRSRPFDLREKAIRIRENIARLCETADSVHLDKSGWSSRPRKLPQVGYFAIWRQFREPLNGGIVLRD